MIQRKLGITALKTYILIEIINAPNGDFILIYFDRNDKQPTIFAHVRYTYKDGQIQFAMFKASTADNTVGISDSAHEMLEFKSIDIAETIRKCLCVDDVMTET